MTWSELTDAAERVVEKTLAELPDPVRDHIRAVPVLMETVPSEVDIDGGIAPDTLGYFDEDAGGLVRIRLWLENIWDFADADPEIYEEEVRTTLLHEIGHVLGWDEEEIEDRGLG